MVWWHLPGGVVVCDVVLADHGDPFFLFSDSLCSFREAEEPNEEAENGGGGNTSNNSSGNSSSRSTR
jgi:hypothetical protein